jgi:hypothetical protein
MEPRELDDEIWAELRQQAIDDNKDQGGYSAIDSDLLLALVKEAIAARKAAR